MDLANTVYCSCTAIKVKPKIHADKPLTRLILNPCGNLTLGTRDHLEHPMAEVILYPALNVSPYCTFFDLEEKTIFQSHKTVLCHYKIFLSLPDFPTRTFIPKKPITRKNTITPVRNNSHQLICILPVVQSHHLYRCACLRRASHYPYNRMSKASLQPLARAAAL